MRVLCNAIPVVLTIIVCASCTMGKRSPDILKLDALVSDYSQSIADDDWDAYLNLVHPACRTFYEKQTTSFLNAKFHASVKDHSHRFRQLSANTLVVELMPKLAADDIESVIIRSRYGIERVYNAYICDRSDMWAEAHFVSWDAKQKCWYIVVPPYTFEEWSNPQPERMDACIRGLEDLSKWSGEVEMDSKRGR